jgi:hypoxanthine phosphoribosyltransferase
MNDCIDKILIPNEDIKARVKELGKQISQDYADKELILVAILRGGFIFIADLARGITIPAQFDFMAVSSYGSAVRSSGVVRIVKDLDMNIADKNVIIVDDIVDSGRTIKYLYDNLMTRSPLSLEVCSLLDKPSERITDIRIKYVGFTIPSKFVVGYGLDYAEGFRHLPDVCTLKPSFLGE